MVLDSGQTSGGIESICSGFNGSASDLRLRLITAASEIEAEK